jgi:hypothetical protein
MEKKPHEWVYFGKKLPAFLLFLIILEKFFKSPDLHYAANWLIIEKTR